MSLIPLIARLQCECGNIYSTDCSTLGINRKICGVCDLRRMVEDKDSVVSVIYFIVSKSDVGNADYKSIVKDLLKNKLSKSTIKNGLKDEVLENACSILNSNDCRMTEIRKDLAEYLSDYDNIFYLIDRLLSKFKK